MTISRRRMLVISAAALVPGRGIADGLNRHRFQAMGADCQITLPGDPDQAINAIHKVQGQIAQIEHVFSLWRPDSALVRLNRDCALEQAPAILINAVHVAKLLWTQSEGAFDLTVQPRWTALMAGRDPDLVPVGMQYLEVVDDTLRFAQPGMAATFNGIAQGIATDHAVRVLQNLGYHDVLANLGEYHGLGTRPDGLPWRLGIANPGSGKIAGDIKLERGAGAVATSEPKGTTIRGRPHIFDPLRRPGPRWASVTVRAATAAYADGLSTALAAAPQDRSQAVLTASAAAEAVMIDQDGSVLRWRNTERS